MTRACGRLRPSRVLAVQSLRKPDPRAGLSLLEAYSCGLTARREGEGGRNGFEPAGSRESAPRFDPFPLSRGSSMSSVSARAVQEAPLSLVSTHSDTAVGIA